MITYQFSDEIIRYDHLRDVFRCLLLQIVTIQVQSFHDEIRLEYRARVSPRVIPYERERDSYAERLGDRANVVTTELMVA